VSTLGQVVSVFLMGAPIVAGVVFFALALEAHDRTIARDHARLDRRLLIRAIVASLDNADRAALRRDRLAETQHLALAASGRAKLAQHVRDYGVTL
jgi:hypothetical protein